MAPLNASTSFARVCTQETASAAECFVSMRQTICLLLAHMNVKEQFNHMAESHLKWYKKKYSQFCNPFFSNDCVGTGFVGQCASRNGCERKSQLLTIKPTVLNVAPSCIWICRMMKPHSHTAMIHQPPALQPWGVINYHSHSSFFPSPHMGQGGGIL